MAILCTLSICAHAGDPVSCTVDGDCTDQSACTTDQCVDGFCVNDAAAGCVSCEPSYICPPIEMVFVMDTSGSMVDEATVLCEIIDQMVADLSSGGTEVIPHILGITNDGGSAFPCISDHVVNLLGGNVPGDGLSCPFPESEYAYESWGPATAIVAQLYPWQQNVVRIIVPISDEGPCNGSRPNGCNDPGDDRDSIDNAINIAINNQVVVSPITGTGATACVTSLATLLANASGGMAKTTDSAQSDFSNSIMQILMNHCDPDFACNDMNECTDIDTCNDGICKGVINYDDSFFCCNPINRQLNWLSDDEDCSDDICDPLTGDVSYVQSADGTLCNDDNLCTDQDNCTAGLCGGIINYDDSQFCCKPSDRSLITLDDGDACTADLCDSVTGNVTHALAETGTPCDDQIDCTTSDVCDDSGFCEGVDVNTVQCNTDNDCFGGVCNFENQKCVCGNHTPELRLIAQPLANDDTCYPIGHRLNVKVELGFSNAIIAGGNFIINYDPDVLRFVSMTTGRNIDPTSPFRLELYESVDESIGQIIYSVGIQIGGSGTTGPATMAGIQFETLTPCASTSLCFTNLGNIKTVLSDDQGVSVPLIPVCSSIIQTISNEPILQCPGSVETHADAGTTMATITWDPVTTGDSCGKDLVPICTATHSEGYDVDALMATGGEFLSGVAEFSCTVNDACGQFDACSWSVTVNPVNIVEVDLQLSPIISEFHQPLKRCIEFHFIDICFHSTLTIEKEINFGLPYNYTGSANKVRFEVPAGNYKCVTARDPKHTVRSSSDLTVVNGIFKARFSGDPTLGGNWLSNGNLDGNNVIDIVDFSLLLSRAGVNVNPDSPCGMEEIHADLNGDGLVNDIDQAMISANFLAVDQPTCCSDGGDGTTSSAPLTEISFYELERMGIYGLEQYDANGDGMLSLDDLNPRVGINRRSRTQIQIKKQNEASGNNVRQLDNSVLHIRQ